MKTRCPACGAQFSLEVLITHEAARHAISNAFKLASELGKHLILYLGLFRSQNRELSFDRVAKILAELLPALEAEQITVKGVTYPAHKAVWVYGIDQAIKARDAGKLTTPLTNHNWLYAVMATYQAGKHTEPSSTTPAKPAARCFDGIHPKDMPTFLARNKNPYETSNETYDRLAKYASLQDLITDFYAAH